MTEYAKLPVAAKFEDLLVWQKAHQLTLAVYQLTKGFPKEELFVLTSQLRRAAMSVPANIAEGFRKSGAAERARFLNIAQGSLEEVRYFLILARDLGYMNLEELSREQVDEVGRLLTGYRAATLKSNR